MSFKPPQSDATRPGEESGERLPPDRAAGRANGATPAEYGRRLSYALFWNFLFSPLGFYYQRNVVRFWTFFAVSILGKTLFSFFFWTWPAFTWGWPHILGVVFVLLGFSVFIIYETVRTHRREPMSDAFYFKTPHSFWFVPVLFGMLFTGATLIEPVEDSILRTHNIPAGSMEPNVQKGDYIYVDYLTGTRDIRRGDMVSFEMHGREGRPGPLYIKRVIGLPGEHIRIYQESMPVGKDKVSVLRIAVNGKPIPVRPTKIDPSTLGMDEIVQQPTLVLEEGKRKYKILEGSGPFYTPQYSGGDWSKGVRLAGDEYFVLGDNRDDSKDSRYIGSVKKSKLRGRYMYTYFSFNFHDRTCSAVMKQLKEGTPPRDIDPGRLCGYRDGMTLGQRIKRFTRASIRWQNIRVAQ